MSTKKQRFRYFWPSISIGVAAMSFVGVGCEHGVDEQEPTYEFATQQASLLQPQSCDELADTMVENYMHMFFSSSRYVASDFSDAAGVGKGEGSGGEAVDGNENSGPSTPGESSNQGPDKTSGDPHFTGTNNHEQAADESDWVKTDGGYIYSVSRTGIAITKSWEPSEFDVKKEINLSEFFRKEDGSQLPPLVGSDYVNINEFVDLSLDGNLLYVYINLPKRFEDEDYGDGGLKGKEDIREGGGEGEKPPVDASSGSGNNGTGSDGGKPDDSGMGMGKGEQRFDYFQLTQEASYKGETRVVVLNISNSELPTVVEALDFEGHYRDARRVESGTYFVQDLNLGDDIIDGALKGDRAFKKELRALWKPVYESKSQEEYRQKRDIALAKIRAKIAAKLTGSYLQGKLPKVVRYNNQFQEVKTSELVTCSDIYVSNSSQRYGAFALSRLPRQKTEDVASVGALTDFSHIYANGSNLYINQSFWTYPTEEETKWEFGPKSVIHKFSFGGANGNKPTYVAHGMVDGVVSNQYAMSEYDGRLRLAASNIIKGGKRAIEARVAVNGEQVSGEQSDSAESAPKSGNGGGAQNPGSGEQSGSTQKPSYLDASGEIVDGTLVNKIYVLKQNGDKLEVEGETKFFGPTEVVRSARFVGDKAYVVTFERTDPFFIFDLSTPAAPVKKGELQLFGFSSYLHPIDATHILGVGYSGDANGANALSAKLVLFDVSNISSPSIVAEKELSTLVPVTSDAATDFLSFNYDTKTKVLSIPYRVIDQNTGNSKESGFKFFNVDTTGFTSLGGIDHQALIKDACDAQTLKDDICNATGYDRGIKTSKTNRSIIMSKEGSNDFYIYTVSPYGIFKQSSTDFSQVTSKFLK